MTPERWQHIDRLFHLALERPPEERAGFLAEACGDDEAVRHEVEALITAHQQSGEFLDSPAYEIASGSLASGSAKLAVGEGLGHYKILGTLGTGGMGEVYLAQDSRLGRKVALKLLSATFTEDAERLRRFEQEARAASALNHPNILTIHEIGSENGLQFIATEFIDGETLRRRIRPRQMKITEAVHIAVEVAEALAAAHAEGIVHRDIKPENIMLRKDSHVKVLDFGLAKLTDNLRNSFGSEEASPLIASLQTSPGLIMGTVAYMSPEQARGLDVDARTDIWSLGVVLYEMLVGRAPFEGATSSDLIASVLQTEPQPLAQHVEETPPRLQQIVTRTLQKQVAERYQTAGELLADLETLKQELEFESQWGHSVRPDSPGREMSRKNARSAIVNSTAVMGNPRLTKSVEFLSQSLSKHPRVAGMTLAMLVIVLAGLTLGIYKFAARKHPTVGVAVAPFQTIKMTRLATGKATRTAISPDGKYLAYVGGAPDQQSLWIRQVAITGSGVRIASAKGNCLGIAYSPDGTYLYYVLVEKPQSGGAIYQVPALGGAPKKLIENVWSHVTIAPDGQRLAFVRADFTQKPEEGSLMVVNADGTGERKLATRRHPPDFFAVMDSGPAWSPDGKMIACPLGTDQDGLRVAMSVVNVADGTVRLFTAPIWNWIWRASWISDGSGLIITAKDQSMANFQIVYLSFPSGEMHRITNDLSSYSDISLTADSTTLVAAQSAELSNVWLAPAEDANRATQITSGVSTYYDISWTPDGKVLYSSTLSGNADIWMMEADGSGQRQLTANADNNYSPLSSPDGRYIVFTSNRAGAYHIWKMNEDGVNPRQLTFGDREEGFPHCSPDGQWVIYVSDDSVWRVPSGGGEPVRISDKIAARPAISPDGRLIACWYRSSEDAQWQLAIMPFSGGAPIRTFDLPPQVSVPGEYLSPVRWMADGHALTYIGSRGGIPNIWRQPLSGGKPVPVTELNSDQIFSFDWSPNNRLVLSRGTVSSDVVLIKDLK